MRECSEAVDEYNEVLGRKNSKPIKISKRTLLYDLEFMKDDTIGFSAPIENDRLDGYYYSNPKFEIFRVNIRKSDLDMLEDALQLLNGINAKKRFDRLETMISRIKETFRIKSDRKAQRYLVQEYVENPDGEKWLSKVSDAIQTKKCISISYNPFDKIPYNRTISPYQIKEYNNRWFLIGFDNDLKLISTMGMDRIKKVNISIKEFVGIEPNALNVFSKDIIGISIPKHQKKILIKFRAYGVQRHYVNTKPLHQSQICLKMTSSFGDFSIEVIPNYELKSKFLSYGETVEVLKPKFFRKEIQMKIIEMVDKYK